jgi:hypothetical protein
VLRAMIEANFFGSALRTVYALADRRTLHNSGFLYNTGVSAGKVHATRFQNIEAACHRVDVFDAEFPLCIPMSGCTFGNAFALSSLVINQ